MKMKIIILLFFSITMFTANAKDYRLLSPDKSNEVHITINDKIEFSVLRHDNNILTVNNINLSIKELGVLGLNPVVKKTNSTSGDEVINVAVPTKFSTIRNSYNQLEIQFKGNYSLIFRAYDNGVAYRFVLADKSDSIHVESEGMHMSLPGMINTLWPYEYDKHENPFLSHFEYLFKKIPFDEIDASPVGLPVYYTAAHNTKVVFSESDLFDYPNLFLKKSGDGFDAVMPHVIAKQERVRDRGIKILEEADYIAATNGRKTFPWRLWMINNDDAGLLTNTLVYQLATPSVIQNTDWIKPGKVAWDWWNANNIYGVDFKSGINNDTYKYYIDFASKFGLEYIILDEGWTRNTLDLLHANPNINIPELVAYGKSKNVDIILWVLWNPLNEKMDEILDLYQSWGVKGIKVDFMARAEQYMVNFYTRTARACADRQLLVDFHGAYKPTGLERTYPNVISFEGVHGLENNKWEATITPEHNATLPFTRMVAGPMDYTPGSMINAVKGNFHPVYSHPMSMGTRAHQTALYVLFESPLQMLADNPSNFLKDENYTAYLSQIPVTWMDTRVLHAEAGRAVIVARKNGDNWYVGGITNWDKFQKEISLDFLDERSYQAEILKDGINADRAAEDYKIERKLVNKVTKIEMEMASGGGFVMILKPEVK